MSSEMILNARKNAAVDAVDISPQEAMVTSLDERLRDAFSSLSVSVETEYSHIMSRIQNADYTSTPGGLFELQVRLGEYKQQVETISAVTRKGVALVETLLRS